MLRLLLLLDQGSNQSKYIPHMNTHTHTHTHTHTLKYTHILYNKLIYCSSRKFAVTDFTPEEIARQMTVLDNELFQKVDVRKSQSSVNIIFLYTCTSYEKLVILVYTSSLYVCVGIGNVILGQGTEWREESNVDSLHYALQQCITVVSLQYFILAQCLYPKVPL